MWTHASTSPTSSSAFIAGTTKGIAKNIRGQNSSFKSTNVKTVLQENDGQTGVIV